MTIEIKIDSLGYGKKKILENVNVTIPSGSFTAVIGRNGSGKSTLLSAVCGMLKPKGEILVGGKDVFKMTSRERACTVSIMLQQAKTPHITVKELVSFGRVPYCGIGERLSEEDIYCIDSAMCEAELEEMANCFVDCISGGEARRSYLGMTLARNTPVILLDEATAFLDTDREANFLNLIDKKRRESGKTVVAVMHDLSNAVKYADYVLLLDNGKAAFYGSTGDLMMTDIVEKIFSVKRFTVDSEGERRIFFSS